MLNRFGKELFRIVENRGGFVKMETSFADVSEVDARQVLAAAKLEKIGDEKESLRSEMEIGWVMAKFTGA